MDCRYGSQQFERTTRTSGEDPAIFSTALETLAIKAFGDMGQTAWLRIIRDHFIAGHNSCELCQHLDSVSPETPMPDIVDRGGGSRTRGEVQRRILPSGRKLQHDHGSGHRRSQSSFLRCWSR